ESHAGDDTITTGSGNDFIAGDVAGVFPVSGSNSATTGSGTGAAYAGNDIIDAGNGFNYVSGGALANFDTTLDNTADVGDYGGEAYADNDEIRTGTGRDRIAGETFTMLNGDATANNSSTAIAGTAGKGIAMAGNDLIVADKGAAP